MSMSPDEGDLSDAISMTSTLVSDEDQEFEVERILAEREVSDEEGEDSTRYLVQWTGYPAHRHSWEPATAFNSKETLQSWGVRKREIASGKRKPFDVRSWEVHCKHVAAETKKRKAKRKRLRDSKTRQAKKTGAPAKTNSNLVDVDRRKSRRRSSVDPVASSALFVPENHTPPSLENTASTQFREQQDNQHPAAPPLRASSGRFVSVNKPFPPGETNSPQSLEKQNSEPSATASKHKATRESAPQLARAAAANSRNSRKSTSAPSAGPANTESEQPAGSHKQKQRQPTLSTGSKNTTIKKPALAEFGPPRERREARQHRWSERSMPLASAIDPKKPSEYAPRTMMSDGTPAMLQADSSPTSEQTQHQLSSELQTSIVGPPRPSDEASNIAAPQSAGQEVPLPTPVPTTASAVSQSLNLAQNSLGSSPALSLANSETNIDEIFNPRGSLSPIDPLGISVEGTTETDLIQTTEPDSNMAPHPPIPTRPRVSIETANLTEKESLPDTRDTGRRFGPFTLESPAPSVDVPHPSDYSVQSPFDRRSPPRRGSPVRHRSPGRRRSPPGGTYWPRRRSFSRDRSFSRSPERRPFFARRSPSPRYSPPPRRDSYRWASPPRESAQRRVPKGGDSYRPGSDRRSIASGNPRSANLRHFSSASDLAPAPTETKAMRDGSSKTSARALEEARIAALIAQMPIRSPPRGAITAPGGYWWDRDNDELLVHVFFGPMRRKIGPLRLCGMGRFVKLDLIRIGKSPNSPEFEVWFKDVCTVEEFDRLRDPNADSTVNTGWFEGFADNNSQLFHMAEDLQVQDRIAICYLPSWEGGPMISLVAWSHGSASFQFPSASNKILPMDVEIPLLVAVQSELLPIETLGPRIPSRPREPSTPALVSNPQVSPQADDYHHAPTGFVPQIPSTTPDDVQREATVRLEALMAERKIDVNELASIEDGVKVSRANYFYLHFPSDDDEAQTDLHLLKLYLSIHGMTVLTSLDPNGWSNFHNNIKMGIVIFHESFSGYSELQPALNLVLHNSMFNYWVIRITKPLQFMDERYFSFSNHCTRMFLKDGVILITEDMLGELKNFAITLQWLRHRMKTKQISTTYHFMLHPGIMEWIEKRLGDENFTKDHGLLGLIKALIMKLNVSDLRKELFNNSSLDPDSSNPIISYPVHGYGTRTEHVEPRIKDTAQRDADHLIEFFAGWALLNRQRFKYFLVLTSFPKSPISQRWASWGHIRVIHDGFKAFFDRFHVKDADNIWALLCSEARPGSSRPTTPVSATTTPRTPVWPTQTTQGLAQSVLQGNQGNRSAKSPQNSPQKSPQKYPAPYL